MLAYKNKLVVDRFNAYQQYLISTLYIKPVSIASDWWYLNDEDKKEYDKHHYRYCYYGCCNAVINYCPYKYPFNDGEKGNIYNINISNKYVDGLKNVNLYNSYINYNTHGKYYKNNLIESLWFNVKNAGEYVNITGNYNINYTAYGYYFLPNNKLYLNNVPVKFIHIKVKNINNDRPFCIKLHYAIDLTPYCNMINYVLKSYYRRRKFILFSYLPIEIIEYILHLSSFC
jgi:hypothetical protein